METSLIQRLPEELLLHVLAYLDNPSPSEVNLRQEPSLGLTKSNHQDYKNIACVSRKLRRLTLPLLFRHTQVRLDQPVRKEWTKCLLCNAGGLNFRLQTGKVPPAPDGIDQYHRDMFENVTAILLKPALPESPNPSLRESFLTWSTRFYHGLRDFLDFLTLHELASSVQTFVLSTSNMVSNKRSRFPHLSAMSSDSRQRCSVEFWEHLLSVLTPERITILAPPVDLACLTTCAIDTSGDWAFGDMDYHALSLYLPSFPDRNKALPTSRNILTEHDIYGYLSRRCPGIAGRSILSLLPWDSISINEGAFIKAYATYEYFERGPPSLIHSIKDALSPRSVYSARLERISEVPLQRLRSFTYTGIFPFANHLDLREMLPQLEVLDLQLAPAPGSDILQLPDRVGKAMMEDLWSELITVYQHIASLLATFRISERNMPHLKKFICRDSKIVNLEAELDEVFVPLCLPVWAEIELGVFTRLRGSADLEEYQNVSWAD